MTLRYLGNLSVLAGVSLAVLSFVSQVKAESGDGSSLVPPDQAEAEVQAASDAPAAEAEAPAPEKAGKSGKSARKTAAAEKAPKKTEEREQAAAADEAVEATLEEIVEPSPRRSRQADLLRAASVKPLIVRYATENGIPVTLADAMVRLESRYNPAARRGGNMGLTQINVQTAKSLGYDGSAAGLLEPETNLRYGLKYLAQAYRLAGGDICGAILRYQFGHRTQTMTGASRAYCAKVKVISASVE